MFSLSLDRYILASIARTAGGIVGKHCPYFHQRNGRHYFFWNRDGKRVEESLRTTDLEITTANGSSFQKTWGSPTHTVDDRGTVRSHKLYFAPPSRYDEGGAVIHMKKRNVI
jgi:hypothetical protein